MCWIDIRPGKSFAEGWYGSLICVCHLISRVQNGKRSGRKRKHGKLCLHSDLHSKHLHHDSISNRLCISSIFILDSSLVSGAYENPHLCLSHRSAFHGDWISTSLKSASLSKYALEPQIIHFLFRRSHETTFYIGFGDHKARRHLHNTVCSLSGM
jgi:hypothetical protein